MGRIDRSGGQDAVMERRHIEAMLRYVEEYERVKSGKHTDFRYAQEFYAARSLCKQNFLKYYRRYVLQGRQISAFIPHKTGRKFKGILAHCPAVVDAVKLFRSQGYNRYEIALLLRSPHALDLSASGVYRLMKKLGISQLNPVIAEEKRRIIKMKAGELGHIDIHYVAKGTLKDAPATKLYILGLIDSYSRLCWLDVLPSIKAVHVAYSATDLLLRLKARYGVEFKEILSDNGAEFASRNNPEHPFEKMLHFWGITHRYTKPATPKTNGKIERFWKTLEHELLAGEQFESIDELKHYLNGYAVYYNEHRIHQGINNQCPANLA